MRARHPSGTRARGPVVLLVEDLDELRSTMAEALTMEGFSVVEAANGREAIERARSVLPDAIVMDLSLPILDGAAATRVLRTYAPTSRIPTLALTGLSVSPSEAQSLGLDGVLRKPCVPEDLAARLRLVIAPRLAGRGDG